MPGEWQIGRATPADWGQVALLWLGATASPEQISSLQQTLAFETASPANWFVARSGDKIDAVLLVLPQPGGIATCWPPCFDLGKSKEEMLPIARHLWDQVKPELQGDGIQLFQALTTNLSSREAEILRSLGFAHVTQLLTMRWSARQGMPPGSGNSETSLVRVADDNEERFRDTLLLTQADALDAPELERYQNPDNIIIGYAEPHHQRWLICNEMNQSVGTMVLSQEGTLGQLIYCGVVPQARRCGIGTFAVQWALQFFRSQDIRRVSVRLDARNLPARHIYERCGFRIHETEELFLSN